VLFRIFAVCFAIVASSPGFHPLGPLFPHML